MKLSRGLGTWGCAAVMALILVTLAACSRGGGGGANSTALTFTGDGNNAYCEESRAGLAERAFEPTLDEDHRDPVAFKASELRYQRYVTESRRLAPSEISDAWKTWSDYYMGTEVRIDEKYGYDQARVKAEGTAEEKAAFENGPPDEVKNQFRRFTTYDSQVCGTEQPHAAEGVTFKGKSDSVFCKSEANEDFGRIASSGGDPAAFRALLTGPAFDAGIEASVANAPPEIKADEVATRDFVAKQRQVWERYGYDFRRIFTDSTPEELKIVNSASPGIRDHYARIAAYDSQVCHP